MAFGSEQNSGKINLPGVYKDPQSGAILTVTMETGADALARLGWERIADYDPDNIQAVVPGDLKEKKVSKSN